MPTIDADAHVLETTKTWSYMRPEESEFRPLLFKRDLEDGAGPHRKIGNELWVIDGKLQHKSNVGKNVPPEARDMIDIERRLQHMDQVGIDIQVLFPTLFLRPLTTEPDVEFALSRS